MRVRVSWGWGTGSPGEPQGYLCHSLVSVHIVYLLHVNLKKKKGATAEVTLPYLEPSVTGFLIR